MNRDFVINVLLIIVGIVLALALFGAGVLWRSRGKASGLIVPPETWATKATLYRLTIFLREFGSRKAEAIASSL